LQNIAEMEKMIDEATRLTRRLNVDLSPPILEGEGLAEAIGWLATQMREQYEVDVQVQVTAEGEPEEAGSFPVPARDRRTLIFQFVRELLFNAIKHAGVDRILVRLQHEGGSYRIDVVDEGAGFDPEQVLQAEATTNGRGLLHTRERLRLVGGRLEIESAPGAGTRVTIVVPPSSLTPITPPTGS
jgi:two-component system CheB/CheR fusion protein